MMSCKYILIVCQSSLLFSLLRNGRNTLAITSLGCRFVHSCHNLFSQLKKTLSEMTDEQVRKATAKQSNKSWDHYVTISLPSKLDENKALNFNVHVYDTGPYEPSAKNPVVVAVHGMPGTGQDFTSLANSLHSKGIRLVAPTSLGMEKSPVDMKQLKEVDFSTMGRTKALKHVLNALDINRVDLVMAHSAGAWTLYEVGAKWDNVDSLLAVNPGGATPNRCIRPYSALKFLVSIMNNSIGRFMLKPFILSAYKIQGLKDVKYGDHLVAAQNYVVNQQFENVPKNAAEIRAKSLPFVMMYAENDKLIESSICSDMAYQQLRIPKDNTVRFSKDSKPNRDPIFVPPGWLCRVLVFARGGHVVYLAYEDEMVQQIQDLLKHSAVMKR
ncbi:hypothetical protein BgiMline_025084 [Biomphalaria glabrata]|nr:hypothetical protein BgiMline_008234 [Biomphalaria glabrata]